MSARIGRPRCQHGLALISVLWVVALLTVVAGALSLSVRHETRFTRNVLSGAQTRAAAEGAVYLALKQLLEGAQTPAERRERALYHVTLGAVPVRVAVVDAAGQIDLNTAAPELLDGLLRSVGVEDWQRADIVDAIQDWRDGDELTRLNGAEDGEYQAAGRPYGAKDGEFASVDELQLVLGMSAALYRRIRGALTVHSRQRGINPAAASRAVLAAVPGLGSDTIDAYVRAREADESRGARALPAPVIDRRFIAAASGVYTIHAAARMQDGTETQLTVTVALRPSESAPFTILDWSEVEPAFFDDAARGAST
jgi:general secretion pathway protein K